LFYDDELISKSIFVQQFEELDFEISPSIITCTQSPVQLTIKFLTSYRPAKYIYDLIYVSDNIALTEVPCNKNGTGLLVTIETKQKSIL
jgi:hypothetical protein